MSDMMHNRRRLFSLSIIFTLDIAALPENKKIIKPENRYFLMFLPKNITVDGISEKVLIAERKSPKWRKSEKKEQICRNGRDRRSFIFRKGRTTCSKNSIPKFLCR
jgi:hypothetical protein